MRIQPVMGRLLYGALLSGTVLFGTALATSASARVLQSPSVPQGEIPETRYTDRRRSQKDMQLPRVKLADTDQLEKNDSSGAAGVLPPGFLDNLPANTPGISRPPVERPPAVVAPEFFGSPREALGEIERLSHAGRGPEAAALAREVAGRVPVGKQSERLLAELNYASGVASNLAGARNPAVESFESAGALAGAGELRQDALYNAGVVLMAQAEMLYQEITEVAGQRLADDPLVNAGKIGAAPDTLFASKARFSEARAVLLDRLRLDWRDIDTRANLELTQRRLEEIARLEEKRDAPMNDKKSDEGKESEKTEEGDDGKDGEQQSEEKREEDGETGRNPDSETEQTEEADPSPGDGSQDGDEMPNPDADAEEDATQPKLEEQEDGEEDEELTSDAGGAELEPEMSQEEVKMILDRLNEIDENAKMMRAARRRTRMIPVERDW